MRWHLKQAARAVHRGGIVAYPTEGVFALGCDPLDPQAVLRILALKRRSAAKGLILIASAFEQLTPYLQPLSAARRRTVLASWPGPVTWLLPARPETPWWLTGAHTTLAVRITGHPLAADLCTAAGTALVSTSANPAGGRPARDALGVRRMFDDAVDVIVHGATGGRHGPSEIRALDGRIIRG